MNSYGSMALLYKNPFCAYGDHFPDIRKMVFPQYGILLNDPADGCLRLGTGGEDFSADQGGRVEIIALSAGI